MKMIKCNSLRHVATTSLFLSQLTSSHPSAFAHSQALQQPLQNHAHEEIRNQRPVKLEGITVFDNDTLSLDDVDISNSKFWGLTTFANLPYVYCLDDESSSLEEAQKFDIAFLGAPFDTGVTARPGARFGPAGIRQGSRRMISAMSNDPITGKNAFTQWAKIVDCGDVPMTVLDNTVALKQLEKGHRMVAARRAKSHDYKTPRIITLGGDHTTTLSALRSTYHHWGPVSVIHFDSHLDTWSPDILGKESEYAGVNHGTFLHVAHEEGLILNSSIHAGIRAPVNTFPGDINNDRRCGFEIISARDIDRIGIPAMVEKIKKRVGDNLVYLSLDIDVLDPAYAPATGTAEVGGWSTRELLTILESLNGLKIIGADVVEVAPIYDNPGETTVLAAAQVAYSLMSLMVGKPIKSVT